MWEMVLSSEQVKELRREVCLQARNSLIFASVVKREIGEFTPRMGRSYLEEESNINILPGVIRVQSIVVWCVLSALWK